MDSPPKNLPSLAHTTSLSTPRLREQVPGVGGKSWLFFLLRLLRLSLSLPRREDPFKLFQTQSSKNHRVELSGSFKCAKERDGLKNYFFFFRDAERRLFMYCGCPVILDLVFWPAPRFLPSWIGGQHCLAQGRERVSIVAARRRQLGRRRAASSACRGPAPALLTSPASRCPQSPTAGRSEGQSGALLQLIDCVFRC